MSFNVNERIIPGNFNVGKYRMVKKGRKRKGAKKLATVGKVKALIRGSQELKYFDTAFTAQSISATGNMDQLTTIPQGDTDITRDGDECLPTSIDIRMVLSSFNTSTPDDTNIVRFVIFRWLNDTSGTTPTLSTILQNSTPTSAFNHDHRGDFEVLLDKIFVFTLYDKTIQHLRWKKKLSARRKLEFIGGATTGRNHLYLMTVSDSALVSHPHQTGYIRINYTDS